MTHRVRTTVLGDIYMLLSSQSIKQNTATLKAVPFEDRLVSQNRTNASVFSTARLGMPLNTEVWLTNGLSLAQVQGE